ncbi:MAG: serine/threonine protein kinase, partial [Planctomycetota bacterium]
MTDEAPTTSDSASRRVGDYELLEPVGVGHRGATYRARHLPSGELAAVKLIGEGVDLDENRAYDHALAARTATKLDHPRIVKRR